MLKTHDKLNRAFPNQLVPIDDSFTLTDADIFGTLEPLNLHGPLYTSMLTKFASYYRKTPRYCKDRLGYLARSKNIRYRTEVGGPVLFRPKQQFPGPFERPSRNMMLTHDLTPRGIDILRKAGRYHAIKHGGWYEHQIATAHLTASIHLAALYLKYPFLPLPVADLSVKVPFEINGNEYENRLVPDSVFGFGKRYFALEADLGNEVGRAEQSHMRKTYERMVLQYLRFIGDKLYHEAYKIPAEQPLLMLFVTTRESKLALIESIIKEHVGACNFILSQYVPEEWFSAFHSPKPIYNLCTDSWKRARRPDFNICNPARQ